MKKDLLFNNFNSFKKAWLVFLLTLFSCYAAVAQNQQVTGKVTDADGAAISGASVKVKGTSTGVITNIDGAFKLSVPGNATLVFSFVGYVPQEVAVGSGSVYNVKLLPNVSNLNEVVVVSVGYGTSRKTDLTGAISSVNAATIAKVPVTSLDQALQGRAAGVQVTNNDASPGGNVTVLIRGTGSLAQYGNGPLYVVDGYPVSTGINNINPNDIASIDVLKDASATAIYGIRAANGVVIVTTKKGRKDGTQVTIDAYSAFQSKPKEYAILNASQFATLADQQEANDPLKHFTVLTPTTGGGGTADWHNPSSLTNADWQNAMYRAGLTQSYNIAVRGGNDKVQSATSVGFYDQKGIVLGSYFKRVTLGLNVDYQATKWLKSSTSAKYTYQDSNNPYGTGSLLNLAQLPPTLDGGNSQTSQISDGKGNYGFFNPIYTYTAKYGNPVYALSTNQYKNINQYFLVNSSLEATLMDGLKIKTSGGVNNSDYSGSYFSPEDDRLVNQFGSGAAATQNANYHQNISNTFEWLWENTISYDKTFGKHSINFVGGVSEQENTSSFMGAGGIPPNSVVRDLATVTNLTFDKYGNGQTIYSLASQFARLTYKFADKYLITGTVRRDGSSKFDVGHKYGVFPTGAVAWKAKQESFLKNVDWVSDLKFRGSYGKVGNQGAIPLFAYEALYAPGTAVTTNNNLGYPFNKVFQPGIAATQPANPNLRWETDYQTDIGMDASFLHGDLNLTVDYFNRKSKDFLLNIAVPAQTGYLTETKNVGTMVNKGWEFALNYSHQINDFHFGAALTVSVIKNKLTSLASGTTFITNPQNNASGALNLTGQGWGTYSETNIGQAVGEFYGYKSLGIFQSQTQVDALNARAKATDPTGTVQQYYKPGTSAGDFYFQDTNGDGHVDAKDQVSLGSPQPKFFGGLNLDGSYKAWDFNAYFYGTYGNKILDYAESDLETFQNRGFQGIENVSVNYYKNAWTPDNHSNTYARIYWDDTNIANGVPSSNWIKNGSYLKLKTLTIGYTLPPDLVKKLSVTKIRVYFSTQNLFTITSYPGLDPEVGTQGGYGSQNGIDNGIYPSSKFYTVGLNVTL